MNKSVNQKIAYFDCFAGISGDMILGALVDAGLALPQLEAELSHLGLSGYTLSAREVKRRGMRGTKVTVEISETGIERHLHDIEAILTASNLPERVKTRSVAIFRRLGEAEASVHGTPVDNVHFHEVGAMDAIVDVVGAVVGLKRLGVERVYASPVHVGRGTVECAHGTLPVPAPATLALLQGVPTYGRDVDAELVTPTGAAIITTLAEGFGYAPPIAVAHVGYGAGSRDLPLPNLLRVSIGTRAAAGEGYEEDVVTVIETNVDDMNPEFYEYVMARLFTAGALDVFLKPIQMKQGRPATQLNVLVAEAQIDPVLAVLFTETTSIGVRAYPVRRWKLQRDIRVVETEYGPVTVKVSRRGGDVLNVSPEYRDCRRIAETQGVQLKKVYQVALAAVGKS